MEKLKTGSKEVEALCGRMQAALGTDCLVTEDVLFSLIMDEGYRSYIQMCRHIPSYVKQLLEHPTRHGQLSSLQQVKELTAQWEQQFPYEDARREYDQKYQRFFKKEGESCKGVNPQAQGRFMEVYLDSCATTKVSPEIARWMRAYYGQEDDANPGSDYAQGRYAQELITQARRDVADVLHTDSSRIVFTSSGSEANNLAIKGIAFSHLKTGGHFVTTAIEHPSVLETMRYLEALGFSVTYVKPDQEGRVHPQDLADAIRNDTLLVSVMAANNEIGTVNPIAEIGDVCREHKVPFLTDAVQAFCKMELDPQKMGISLLSFSGHKIYAPKGAGGLYLAPDTALIPQIHGGGQEGGMRSGTENTAAIAALGMAAKCAYAKMAQEQPRIRALREDFLQKIMQIDSRTVVYGSLKDRIDQNLCLGFYGVSGHALSDSLNKAGICVSTGSACSAKKKASSHVLAAIGADVRHYGMVRMGLGIDTTKEQLDYVAECLKNILPILRKDNRW